MDLKGFAKKSIESCQTEKKIFTKHLDLVSKHASQAAEYSPQFSF